MAKRLILGPILARLVQIWALIFFLFFGWGGEGGYLYQVLDIAASYHCMQYQRKRIIQTQDIGEKTHFEHNFGTLRPKSGRDKVFQHFLSHFIKRAKILLNWFFFFKNLALAVTWYHGQLSSCTISEKTNDSILRKFSDGRTDGRTDESFHRTLSNAERPKWKKK